MGCAVSAVVVGVDGGNSKTEVAVAGADGTVLSLVRGPGSSPAKLGDESALAVVSATVERALAEAGRAEEPIAVATLLAGLDLPEDAPAFERVLAARYPRPARVVDNDTVAVLLAGTRGEPGAAVICGAGINAAGMAPSGERLGFLSLGRLSGDWGGGLGLGREVLWHAVRDEDGRGVRTDLTAGVREHFGTASVTDVVLAVHRGQLPEHRLGELVPVLLAADAAGDAVARDLMGRLAREMAGMAQVMLTRCGLGDTPAPVVLAGGVVTRRDSGLADAVARELAVTCPKATTTVLGCRPVAGAVVAALRAAGGDVDPEVAARVTTAAVLRADVASEVDG